MFALRCRSASSCCMRPSALTPNPTCSVRCDRRLSDISFCMNLLLYAHQLAFCRPCCYHRAAAVAGPPTFTLGVQRGWVCGYSSRGTTFDSTFLNLFCHMTGRHSAMHATPTAASSTRPQSPPDHVSRTLPLQVLEQQIDVVALLCHTFFPLRDLLPLQRSLASRAGAFSL